MSTNEEMIAAMRAKLANLTKKRDNDTFLKLDAGENILRIVPLKGNAIDPFQEVLIHYLQNKSYFSPRNYGEIDPLADFSDQLVSAGGLSKEEFKEAKKLSPQIRTYALVIVRGKEAEGLKFWSIGKKVYTTILGIFDDDDYGNITDPNTGHDLKVIYTPKNEKDANSFPQTEVHAKPKSSKLTTDKEQLESWLNEQPVLFEQFTRHTKEQLDAVLAKYLDPNSTASTTSAQSTEPAKTGKNAEWASDPKAPEAKPISKDVQNEFDAVFNS